MRLLWIAICAVMAANPSAVDELLRCLWTDEEPLIVYPLLTGLMHLGKLEEADKLAKRLSQRYSLRPWQLDRVLAETRLDAKTQPILQDARGRLKKLDADEQIPTPERAEIAHNLGTALDRLGEKEAAIAAFQRALTFDPTLQEAQEELKRLQSPPPAS
jgi:tetratricopeptide (TPR) repeat protein